MRVGVRNVAYRGIARNAVALAIALSGLPIAVLNAARVVPGHPMLTVMIACAIAAAIAPSSRASGRAEGVVSIDGSTLRVESGRWRRAWATRDVTGAWTENEGSRVVLRDRRGRTLSFDTASPAETEALLEAASLGPGVRVTRIPIGGARTSGRAAALMFGSLFFTALGLLMLVGVVRVLGVLPVRASFGPILVFGIVGFASLRIARRWFLRVRVLDVAVGRDGVLIPRLVLPARRVSFGAISSIAVAESSLTLAMKDKPLTLPAARREQAQALADAINEALRNYRTAAQVDRTPLHREGRTAAEWTAHLRELAGRARTYREGFEIADLVAIAEDPVTSPEDRIAAALVVARIDDRLHPRLRVAAEGTVNAALRAAMLSAIEHAVVDEESLRRVRS